MLHHEKNDEGQTEFYLNGEQIDADEVCIAFNNMERRVIALETPPEPATIPDFLRCS